MTRIILKSTVLLAIVLAGLTSTMAFGQGLAKAQVANLIAKVENGVDQFRDFAEKRGESAKDTAGTRQAAGRGRTGQATESQKNTAKAKKDELNDSLEELNRSTNRLRRKFDGTDKWIETKSEVQRVVDDGRKVNQAVTRGNYGSDAARLWAALRNSINDLARAYNVPPLGA